MSTPVEGSPFGGPGDAPPPVTFSQGGQQTFKGTIADGLYPATLVKVVGCVSTFEGKTTDQYAWLFQVEGRTGDGEVCFYTSRKISTNSKAKLIPLLTALKLPVPTPENPALPNPIGAKARLLIKNEPKRDGSGLRITVKEVLSA